jgi:adenylate cyclase
MATEIERKFLVTSDAWRASVMDGIEGGEGTPYVQAYIFADERKSVRVRLAGERGVKGAREGIARDEFEYEIPAADARAMIERLAGDRVGKRRFVVPFEGHDWEVDVFDGENQGLVVAEIELGAEDEAFARPSWLGEEVTHDVRYLNTNLAKVPFSRWR